MTAADDTGLVLRAAQFAAMKHRNQRRMDKEATPYINHPLALANVLWHEGGRRRGDGQQEAGQENQEEASGRASRRSCRRPPNW